VLSFLVTDPQIIDPSYSLQGTNVRTELFGIVSELPALYAELATEVQRPEFASVLQFFLAFIQFLGPDLHLQDTAVPILRHIVQHGNTTAHFFETGTEPMFPTIETEHQIVIEESSQPVEITLIPTEVATAGEENAATGEGEIDWDIEVLPQDAEITLNELEVGGAPAPSLETVLDQVILRNRFLDDLFEIQTFLQQRVAEMRGKADLVSTNMFQTAPEIIQRQTVDSVQSYERIIDSVILKLTNARIRHLFLIMASPK